MFNQAKHLGLIAALAIACMAPFPARSADSCQDELASKSEARFFSLIEDSSDRLLAEAMAFDERFGRTLQPTNHLHRPELVVERLSVYADVARRRHLLHLIDPYLAKPILPLLRRDLPSPKWRSFERVGGGLPLYGLEEVVETDRYIVLYHGTDRQSAHEIITRGVDLRKGRGEFGPGFYLTSNPRQAWEWAEVSHGQEAQVLVFVIKRSEMERALERQWSLRFDVSKPENHVFRNFVALNRRLRNLEDSFGERYETPVNEIGVIYGPSVSSVSGRGGLLVEQIRFAPSRANQVLFARDNPFVALYLWR